MLRRLWGRTVGFFLSPLARAYYRRPRLRRLLKPVSSPILSIPLPAIELTQGPLKGKRLTLDGQVLCHYLGIADHEDHVLSRIGKFVHSGSTVVDAGANIGYFSLILAGIVGKSGRVFAFEPDPVVTRAMRRNIELNGLTATIIPHNSAVSAEAGEIRFDAAGDMISRVVDASSSDGDSGPVGNVISVPCVTLDSIFPDNQKDGEDPCFLKIDVEGHEFAVLRGAERLISRAHPVIFLEAHHARAYTDCVRFLRDKGYRIESLTNPEDTARLDATIETGANGEGGVRIPIHLWCVPSDAAA